MSIAAISILVGGGLPTFKNGLIMKKINAIILLSSLTSASVFAGAYVENREAYNLASDQGEVMLRVGYNFDMGAGIMLTNTYTFPANSSRTGVNTPVYVAGLERGVRPIGL